MSSPIEITIYEKGADPGPGTLFEKKIVSIDVIRRAMRLSEELDKTEEKTEQPLATDFLSRFKRWIHRNDRVLSSQEEIIDRLAEFVVDVFDAQFTIQQLNAGAEFSELMNVLRAITAKAHAMPQGPTNPPTMRLRRKR